jgi:hypothetical protein
MTYSTYDPVAPTTVLNPAVSYLSLFRSKLSMFLQNLPPTTPTIPNPHVVSVVPTQALVLNPTVSYLSLSRSKLSMFLQNISPISTPTIPNPVAPKADEMIVVSYSNSP